MTPFVCPICQNPINGENIMGLTAICPCGWVGPTNFYSLKQKRKTRKRIEQEVLALVLVAVGFCYYEWHNWGRFFSNHIILQTKILTGAATEDDWVDLGIICNTTHHYGCSETAFSKVLKYEPENVIALANLAIAQTKLGKHQDALLNFEKIFSKGEGSAETMAYYGMSLEALGRGSDAEKWYYRALSQEPNLVDIADHLIDSLVKHAAYTEALSVIGDISSLVPAEKEYFQSRVLLISDLSVKNEKETSKNTVQLASLQSHHFIPIRFSGMKTPAFFMVDTGATFLTLNPEFIESQNITDFTTVSKIKLVLAGGQIVDGTLISLKHIRIGPWQLENIQAAICSGCVLLAGKSVLHLFQTTTKEVGGVEYLTLQK